MELSEIRPTAKQVAELDQKAADLATLGRLLGMFRKTLVDAGFDADEAYAFAARLYDTAIRPCLADDE